MIPIVEEAKIEFNIEEDKDFSLLRKEIDYCNKHRQEIIKNSIRVYNAVIRHEWESLEKRCCDFKLLEQKCKQYKNNKEMLYEKNWILFDDVIYVLEKLKDNYKLVIVSNGDGHQQRKKIEYTGLQKYFSEIIISSEVGASKPDKEIFKIACKKINIEPENCIIVGDKYKVDIEGCINIGMRGIWINRKKETLNYKYTINELSELFKYLQN